MAEKDTTETQEQTRNPSDEQQNSGDTQSKNEDISVEQLFKDLDSSKDGLSDDQADQRHEKYGYNEIEEKKKSVILKFLSYFWGPIPWMIEAAAILSVVVHHWEDFIIIMALLLLNAAVGFWQEHKADNAIELLKKKMALEARVKRNGEWTKKPARELVPGDVVRVRLGDIVPADLKLFGDGYLRADESALTGESLPVEKGSGDVAYSGSNAQQGEMDALVTDIGEDTFFGRTASMLNEEKTTSHFQRAVMKIGDYLIVLAVVLVIVILMVALFRQESLLTTLQFALVLTVAAIPVALPAVMSVTMAVGATKLAKKEAIVSNLPAIEEIAGMDLLCSDKTGTITKNELTLAEVVPFGDRSKEEVLYAAALASRKENSDPIDDAVIEGAEKDEDTKSKLAKAEVTDFTPFDPVNKRTEAEVKKEGGSFHVAKGAAQAILEMAGNPEDLSDEIDEKVDAFASKGYRALAVAEGEGDDWHVIGLLALYDPPRDDSKETVNAAHEMGVDVKMITGDHLAIGKEISREVGLGENLKLPDVILQKSDREATKEIESADGFAQVFPEHKYKIVEHLQEADHIVGMTGDGVNDAPALKKADVGIAVAGATEAARSAADIVLTLPGLSVIVDAIRESRKIFQRMNSYAIYRIAETIRVLLFITLSILVFNFYPVTAIMIVLLALLNDAPIMAISNDNVRGSDVPEKWNMRVVLSMASLLGIVGVIWSFALFYIGRDLLKLDQGVLQSLIFLKLAVAGHLTIFVTRTRHAFWSIKPSGALFWSAVVTKVIATLVAVYGFYVSPIGWKLAGIVWGYAFIAFLVMDAFKVWAYKLLDHEGLRFAR